LTTHLGTGSDQLPPIIATQALSKIYPGDVRAVVDLCMEVRAGEVYGFLGPNGAGKSTTIGMLTTRVIPTSGMARVGGVDIIRDAAIAKQVIGVVPQTNTLDRALTVFDNLYYHGRYFGMSAKEARLATDELLVTVRLADRARAAVGALSGGMAQRLMVGRAIMHRPQVLFLDEPTAGLDPQNRLALWEILKQVHAEGQTIFLTTHHMDEADLLCDRVAIMDRGRILALDTPNALKEAAGADSVVRIQTTGDHDDVAEHLLERVVGATDARVVDDSIHLWASGHALLPRVMDAAGEIGAEITDLSLSEPTLESVFINLTGKDLRE
jgi:ABC-2 type transport system ATP-binding protein